LHAFLETAGYAANPVVNKAYRQTDGSLIALLSPTEILWLRASASDEAITRWNCPDGQPLAPQTYLVPRSDGTYWFQLAGEEAEVALSRLCSVDFSHKNCPDLSVAQTLVARINTIVIHDRDAGESRFHLIGDVSLATYMWEALTSATTGILPHRA
jgi:sarcosine oxidase gamma subunit